MPTSVAVAVAADAAATYVADALIFDLVATTTLDWVATYAVLQTASSFVIGAAMRGALSGGADEAPTSGPAFNSQAQARTHVIRSAVANRQIIYGRAMVSGPLLFAATDESKNYLHLVVALAGHECDAVEQVYFNDEPIGDLATEFIAGTPGTPGTPISMDENQVYHEGVAAVPATSEVDIGDVTSGAYAGYARVVAHLGAADQGAELGLVNAGLGWTTAHRLQGVTYLYVRLRWNRDVFPRGIPNIKAVVRGKKLYDPRTGLAAWSDNWALAVRDYLAAPHGLRCTDAEIDDAAIAAAANIADEAVTLADGTTEPRYTCNGVMDTGQTPKAIMQALLSGGAGTLTWPGGVYTLAAGVYDAPEAALDEDDLRGTVRVRARVARQDLYNAIKGTFVDPDQHWQPVDFPPKTNATYEAQDGGDRIWRDVAYPVTTRSATAQRLAKLALEKSRQGITVDMPCKLTAFKVRVWDTVTLSLGHLGWTDKVFRVTAWRFAESGGVDLTLQEEAAACYAWSAEETVEDPAPDTNLPDPRVVAAPGTPTVIETLFETTGSAGVKARANVWWPASTDAFVVDYLPEYRLAGGTWITLPATTDQSLKINDIAPGSYEFRLRARNASAALSDYSGTCALEILGLTAAPGDVGGFYVVPGGGQAWAQWSLTSDLDVRIGGRIVVRHSSLASGATWEDGVVLREFAGSAVGGPLPLLAGTYLAKAQDSSGNWSGGTASFYASADFAHGWTPVATLTESPGFTGSKTSVAVSAGELSLDSSLLVDGVTDLLDDWASVDTIGGVSATGSYAFSVTMDMTTVAVRNFTLDLTAAAFDTGDAIDGRTTEVDTWDAIDGAAVNDCTVTPYIRVTPDDPAGSPVWGEWTPFWVADFNCRAAQFRLDFQSGSRSHNISVSALAVRSRVFS